MVNLLQGELNVSKVRVAIVVARYNESITTKLLDGAVATLLQAGVADEQIDVVHVPGAWEISLLASELARQKKYDSVICLGAVIRGETTHDQHINRQVSLTLGRIGVKYRLPVMFGILTCNSLEQAFHRSGGNVGNKGAECAEAALEMIGLLGQIRHK